ncbi:MAG: hypothetical protein U0L11_11140, partial [Acutalibacteraceae bacterium]|nr:hypothetical protein [Acutalibacteraceae bacterium]
DCTICGKNFDKKDKFEGHAAEKCVCKECGVEVLVVNDEKTHKCADADKIINTVKDPATWETLFNKIVEFVKTIDFDALIAEVEGIIAEVEALLADIDFEGILADVKGMFA